MKTGTKEKIPFPPKKKGLTLLYQTYASYMVPRRRVELRIEPYHGSVNRLTSGATAAFLQRK